MRKRILVLIGIILGITAITDDNKPVNAKSIDLSNITSAYIAQIKILSANANWKKLNTIWKDLNKYEQTMSDLNTLSDSERSKLNTKIQKARTYIDNLSKEGLLTDTEKESLYTVFNSRLSHIVSSSMMCYEAMPVRAPFLYDLATRYKLLEKLYGENKINQETYKKTFNDIEKDFKNLKEKDPERFQKITVSNDLIEIIMLLNK